MICLVLVFERSFIAYVVVEFDPSCVTIIFQSKQLPLAYELYCLYVLLCPLRGSYVIYVLVEFDPSFDTLFNLSSNQL